MITIQQIGNDMSCLVLEHREDRKIHFMRTYYKKGLSEYTRVAGTKWSDLKSDAMSRDYKQKRWFAGLTNDEKLLLEALRAAQAK